MNLETLWQELSKQEVNTAFNGLDIPKISQSSNNMLRLLKRNLLINLLFGVGILLAYGVVLIQYPIPVVQICFLVVMGFSFWLTTTSYQQYKNIHVDINPDNQLLGSLEKVYNEITTWIKTQERISLFIYPWSIIGGFLLGAVEGSGKEVAYFLAKPSIQMLLAICLLVLVPTCYYVAKWLLHISFGQYLRRLEENIETLKGT